MLVSMSRFGRRVTPGFPAMARLRFAARSA